MNLVKPWRSALVPFIWTVPSHADYIAALPRWSIFGSDYVVLVVYCMTAQK